MSLVVHHQTLAVSRAAQRTWLELTSDAIPIVSMLPAADGITGTVDVVCSRQPDRDWPACLAAIRALGDAVRLVFPVRPSPRLHMELDAVGYVMESPGALRYVVRGRRTALPADAELGLVGPIACRVLGGRRGVYEVDGPGRLAPSSRPTPVVGDGTPWAKWLGDLAATAPDAPSGGAAATISRPVPAMLSVEMDGFPVPVDTSPARPVIALAHPFARLSEVAAAAHRLGVPTDRVDELRTGGPGRDRVMETRAFISAVRRAAADASLVVLPAVGFRNDLDRALAAIVSGSMGIPVIADHVTPMARYLGPETLAAIRNVPVPRLSADAYARDRHGVRLLRAVETEHGSRMDSDAEGAKPLLPSLSLSVIVQAATAAAAAQAVTSIRSQTAPVAEILIAGPAPVDRPPSEADDESDAAVILVPGDRSTHPGERLNRAVGMASGDLIALWSDADRYGCDHLRDLTAGLVRSRADVAGKPAEFEYLRALDVTVQRPPDDRYQYATEVAPRSLVLRRVTALELGGFPRSSGDPRAAFVARIPASGGRVYRTHGWGYLVYSPGCGAHSAAVLSRGVRQWPGQALSEAGVSAGPYRPTRRYR